MRVNRNIGVGLGFIALALILLVVLFRGRSNDGPGDVDNVPTAQNASIDETPVSGGSHVAYALDTIPDNTILTSDMFGMRALTEEERDGTMAADFITDPEDQAIGFVTRVSIPKDGDLRKGDFKGHVSKLGLASVIRPGFRGMVVPVITDPTLHDLVKIGDSVDVVAAFDGQESRTIVQNVRVLAVDVYGGDFPQVKVAMRGNNRAEMRTAPPVVERPGAVPQDAPTATPGPPPPPTPTPPPAAAPSPALTLEVTPAQATAISLAEAAGAPLDFLLRPRVAPGPTTLASASLEPRPAVMTRARIAPYAEGVKRGTAAAARPRPAGPAVVVNPAPREPRGGGPRLTGGSTTTPPDFNSGPGPGTTTIIEPIRVPPQPQTYDIPIYADGKLVRTDTVRKPE